MSSSIIIAPDPETCARRRKLFLMRLALAIGVCGWMLYTGMTPGRELAWLGAALVQIDVAQFYLAWRAQRAGLMATVELNASGITVLEANGERWSALWRELRIVRGRASGFTLQPGASSHRQVPLQPDAAGAPQLFAAVDRWLPREVEAREHRFSSSGVLPNEISATGIAFALAFGLPLLAWVLSIVIGALLTLLVRRWYGIDSTKVEKVSLLQRRAIAMDAVTRTEFGLGKSGGWRCVIESRDGDPLEVLLPDAAVARAYTLLRAVAPATAVRTLTAAPSGVAVRDATA